MITRSALARCFVLGLLGLQLGGALASLPRAMGQDEEKKKKATPPADIEFATRDGFAIKATYYAGKDTRDTVPVILLHDYKGNRSDLHQFALYLQAQGHAVIAPDLRGHGESTSQMYLGKMRTVKADQIHGVDFKNMAQYDLERVKRFLLDRNNEGKLNIEKLCVVGVENGASLAMAFAAHDWLYPLQPRSKNGQDVKAVVLVSPRLKDKLAEASLDIRSAYKVQSEAQLRLEGEFGDRLALPALNVHLIYGANKKDYLADANQLYSLMEKKHWIQPKTATPEEIAEKKDLFKDGRETVLQGAKMFGADLGVEERIAKFIELRLVKKKEYRWMDRRSDLEKN